MRWLLFILGLSIFIVGMQWGGSISAFIDEPSLLIVLGPTLLIPSGIHSVGTVINALRNGMFATTLDAAETTQSVAALRTMRAVSLSSGVLGVLIGIVQMLADLSDPAKIGPAMAVAILTPFYGVFFGGLFLSPLIHRLQGIPPQSSETA